MTAGPQDNSNAQPVEPEEQPPNSDWVKMEKQRDGEPSERRETK